ncbi:MAG: acetyl-CoA carboxylase biotin carboxylase subunit [Anaerolineae bacterium]
MKKVLIANRGEIAVRIMRTCRDLGISTVAVYSEGDREALHARYADEALAIGPTPARLSYLNIRALVDAARKSGADAIHPGYGFLSENAGFAEAVEDAGLVFIGPRPETLALTGDKLAARRAAREAGLPVLPGPDHPVDRAALAGWPLRQGPLADLRFPMLVKAVAGGGGRGIRLVEDPETLPSVVAAARREAAAAFGDGEVYLEPLVERARHIEVQIVGDGAGRVLCLGERECSVQRRRQKLIEESPAPGLSSAQRTYLFEAAVQLAAALRYRSLGTVEFLLDRAGAFHFIEVNPRIQVEHPVTEMVTGMDLVAEQLRLAAGQPLRYAQDEVSFNGAAIEARVLAEDPTPLCGAGGVRGQLSGAFLPTTGEITYLKEPGGPGIRVDSALFQGMQVTTDYDSLLAKVIAWGDSRAEALVRLRRALREFQIGGVVTDSGFLLQILESAPFVGGDVHTTFLDEFHPSRPLRVAALESDVAAAAALLAHRQRSRVQPAGEGASGGNWRMTAWREQM